ncbi:MAG: cupin domain-containing protein [Xanthomonadales bacterium]|nr:cupin domain-containing protein [Xanthomonadales bacterium]
MTGATITDVVFFTQQQGVFEEWQTDAKKCIRGQPLQRSWHQFTSSDKKFFSGIWEAEPGCWNIAYTENEYCHILAGKSVLRDTAGNEHALNPGDQFTIPAGFAGQWEVLETTRKIYVIYQP